MNLLFVNMIYNTVLGNVYSIFQFKNCVSVICSTSYCLCNTLTDPGIYVCMVYSDKLWSEVRISY